MLLAQGSGTSEGSDFQASELVSLNWCVQAPGSKFGAGRNAPSGLLGPAGAVVN